MMLPFLMSCNENHDFSLDESRQLLIVHNFLHMEIESDCLDPSESHLFFITKKNDFDARSCDTINFKNVSSTLSVEEMNSYGITKNLRRIKFRPNTRYVVIHSGMGAQVYIKEYFWADSRGKLRRSLEPGRWFPRCTYKILQDCHIIYLINRLVKQANVYRHMEKDMFHNRLLEVM